MPIAKVQLPDGRIARFEVPDGTSPDQVQEFAAKQFMVPEQRTQADNYRDVAKEMGPIRSALAKAGGTTLDAISGIFGDNAAQGVQSMLTGTSTDQAGRQQAASALRQTHPVASLVGDIGANAGMMYAGGAALRGAGGLAGAVNATRAGDALQLAGRALQAPTSWQQAAAGGAGYSAATTQGDLLDRAEAAAAGGLGGGLGYGAAKALGAGADRIRTAASERVAAQRAQDAVRNATLESGRTAGYVATPSTANAGVGSRLLEGLSGKFKTEQAAMIKNQGTTDTLARMALGLGEDATLTPDVLNRLRSQAFNAGYSPVRGAGPIQTDSAYDQALKQITAAHTGASRSFPGARDNGVNDLIDTLKQPIFDAADGIDMTRLLRDQADAAYRQGNNALGKAAKDASKAIEDQIERHLAGAGEDGAAALKAFKDARQMIAKTHTVERALVEGSGRVSAPKIAQELARGKPLTKELRTIAEYAQAFPKLTRMPDSGNSNPLTAVDFGIGGIGLGSGNAAAVALPFARVGARSLIMSPAYQRAFVNPQYSAPLLPGLLDAAGVGAQRLSSPAAVQFLNQR